MSWFEGLSKVITETSATAVNKTKELTRIARINASISDERKAIEAAYTEIGRRYVENFSAERRDLFGDQMDLIAAAQKRIEALNRELEELKRLGKCPNCGAPIETGTAFCSSCGARLSSPADQGPQDPQV